jgi:hypothetical protein
MKFQYLIRPQIIGGWLWSTMPPVETDGYAFLKPTQVGWEIDHWGERSAVPVVGFNKLIFIISTQALR